MHLCRHHIRVLSVNVFFRALSLIAALWPVNANSEPVSFGDLLQLPIAEVAQTHAYGSSPQNTVVNIRGSDSSRGAITLIHGGCWSNAYDRNHTLPMAEALSTMGYDVWVPEYRRVGDAGGGWPGSLDDIIEAIEFVTNKTGKQPILVGHSAGGHLSLRAAQTGLAVGGVVGLAPITDLVAYGAEPGSCQSMVAPFMGDDTFTPDVSYRNASVTLSAITVPVVVVIGKEDPIVRAAQVAVFSDEQVITVENSGHFDVIHPKTEAFSAVLTALETIKAKGQ
jgi:acetyl esterase/lipase